MENELSSATDEFEPTSAGDRNQRLQQIAEQARQLTVELVTLMGIGEAEVELVGTSDREISLEISAHNAGMLIGRHGETLDALQLIVAIGANKGFREGARIVLDTEGYRNRHVKMLEDMARSYASKVKERGQELVVEDLKAYERRIIHMTLRDEPDVETYSEGDGTDRVLVISPVTK
jgi:spoIIIJ-associated protein